jgi:ribonuclease HI
MEFDIETVICQLRAYSRRHSGPKSELASAAANYLELRKTFGRLNEEIFADPFLQEIIGAAQLEIACGWRPTADALTKTHFIYCDGCCLGNGAVGARAGFGIYVTDASGSVQFVGSFRLPAEDAQTNQRAELQALNYALSIVSENPSIRYSIYTDSRYAMDCLEKWAPAWEASGWRKSDNKPVLHSDLIKDCLTLYRRESEHMKLHHISAHTGFDDPHSRGNAEADRLARIGAEKPTE